MFGWLGSSAGEKKHTKKTKKNNILAGAVKQLLASKIKLNESRKKEKKICIFFLFKICSLNIWSTCFVPAQGKLWWKQTASAAGFIVLYIWIKFIRAYKKGHFVKCFFEVPGRGVLRWNRGLILEVKLHPNRTVTSFNSEASCSKRSLPDPQSNDVQLLQ